MVPMAQITSVAVVLLVVASACGPAARNSPPSPAVATAARTIAASSTPSSAASHSFAVLVDFPNGTGPQSTGYDLVLVATDGHIAGRVHAATRSFIHTVGGPGGAAAPDLPEVSVANDRVYYLDGDQQVSYLGPDGSTATVTKVPGSASAHAGFAVSPDGSRIAVSVLAYQGNAASMTLYVEDSGGGNHHVIFQSSSEYAWPVAWHRSYLVLAIGPLFSQQGLVLNPYFASSYHVVDPASADRKATIGGPDYISACEVSGLLVSAGTACFHRANNQSEFWLLDWTGHQFAISAAASPYSVGSLAPSTGQVAICCNDSTAVVVNHPAGDFTATQLKGSDSWPCWLDDQRVLVGSVNQHQFQPGVLDVATGRVILVDAHGFCAAVLGGPGTVR